MKSNFLNISNDYYWVKNESVALAPHPRNLIHTHMDSNALEMHLNAPSIKNFSPENPGIYYRGYGGEAGKFLIGGAFRTHLNPYGF